MSVARGQGRARGRGIARGARGADPVRGVVRVTSPEPAIAREEEREPPRLV